jgi:chemotaxis signal transduction protein
MTPADERTRWRTDVAAMRQEFDRTFAVPESSAVGACDDFLAIRVCGHPFALRVLDLTRIETHRKVVALPESNPWLLGLASSQGKIVPVYSLALVLDLPVSSAGKSWLAICGREVQLGLAFDSLEGYFRIPRAEVLGAPETVEHRSHAQQTVRAAGTLWSVVSLTSVLAAIRERAGHTDARGG